MMKKLLALRDDDEFYTVKDESEKAEI